MVFYSLATTFVLYRFIVVKLLVTIVRIVIGGDIDIWLSKIGAS